MTPAAFVGSFPDPLQRLDPPLPEFALIGRSNVGKSSLLNALAGRRALARVSATPGKTQLLNVYRFPAFYLIDLPGYGFAHASRTDRAAYRDLLERLLAGRTLHGVVWLLDVRHPPSRDDRDFQELLAASAHAVLPVLTKVDKLSRRQVETARADRAAELGLDAGRFEAVSARTGHGITDLLEALDQRAKEGL